MSNISEATQHDWEDFGIPLKSLEHGIALTLRKCGRKWIKSNH